MKCRKCGAGWTHYEEKETDVNIATSLVSDAAQRVADSALIISADSDLTPAVKATKVLHPTLFVAAAFPPKRFSAELKKLMPGSFHINGAKIRQSQLPHDVTDAAGRTYSRPAKWS
ncbi:hypothetical protein JCM18899A_39360 [Nocardioides sp. AN3]